MSLEIKKILELTRKEKSSFERGNNTSISYWEDSQENMNEIMGKMDKICTLISKITKV